MILDVASYSEYTALIRPALYALGAEEDTGQGAPLCRWLLGGVIVDVMPVEASALGFTNRWYPTALASARRHTLPDGTDILVLDAPHFLATKIEAFVGRGRGDFLASKDIEDIIAVVEGRLELLSEVSAAAPALRSYLATHFEGWLKTPEFHDAVLGYLGGAADAEVRADIVIGRVRALLHRN